AQNRTLKTFHPVIESVQDVTIFSLLSPIAQHANRPRILGIVGCNRAALAVGSEVLRGIKTEARYVADAPHWPSFVLRTVRLRRIFDDYEFVSLRHFHDRVHVRGLAVKMHRENCFSARSDGRLDHSSIHG